MSTSIAHDEFDPEQLATMGATLNETTLSAQQTTTLSPRFYTTDFDEMDRISVDSVRPQWDALLAELASDPNRHHFKRNDQWDFDESSLTGELRKEFMDFLVSSLTAEFSGCVLYAEIRKRGTNPDLCALFKYMARDESRHAGFINDALKDFGVGVDLGFLTKAKQYTFFKPKFIFYATYLSEKIGYARYITIFRHLEKHPERRFHPIFKWFHQWCNDEFRHGEAFALLMRANPGLLRGMNLVWIRFFQLAVFATMFVRDHARPAFHKALGLEPESYGMQVFRVTTAICRQVFPVLLDVENPAFLSGLQKLNALNTQLSEHLAQGGLLGHARAMAVRLRIGATFLRLLAMPAHSNALPTDIRMAPTW
jgi:magnesium-protoporphyrin IX monomethyl ester (oxidative) cyclase